MEEILLHIDARIQEATRVMQEMGDGSVAAGIVREVLPDYERLVQARFHLSELNDLAYRMKLCIEMRPRLLLQVHRLQLEALQHIDEPSTREQAIRKEVAQEIAFLEANIQAADAGRWSDVQSPGMLQHDPVEWTAAFENVIDEAEHRAFSHLTDVPRGMGFCFAYWPALRSELHRLGIEWHSPSEMNPGVIFD